MDLSRYEIWAHWVAASISSPRRDAKSVVSWGRFLANGRWIHDVSGVDSLRAAWMSRARATISGWAVARSVRRLMKFSHMVEVSRASCHMYGSMTRFAFCLWTLKACGSEASAW